MPDRRHNGRNLRRRAQRFCIVGFSHASTAGDFASAGGMSQQLLHHCAFHMKHCCVCCTNLRPKVAHGGVHM